jgi:diguanylate cyclase (GGDEF)-like protein
MHEVSRLRKRFLSAVLRARLFLRAFSNVPGRAKDAQVAAAAFAILSIFGLPLLLVLGPTLQRQNDDVRADELREAGLDVLERERAVEGAIRTLRADAVARRRITLSDRYAVDRALLRLDDAVSGSAFNRDVHPRIVALRAAWSRIPEAGRTLGAVDAVLAEDEDFVTAIRERAALGEGSDTVAGDALNLYVSILPAIGDRMDQLRNLTFAAAAAHRVPNGSDITVDIFTAQASREYISAISAAERIGAGSGNRHEVLDALRRVGFAQSQFEAVVRSALAYPGRPARESGRVGARARTLETALDEASSLALGLVRERLAATIESEHRLVARTWWIAVLAWGAALSFAIVAARIMRRQQQDARSRLLAAGEARRHEMAARLAGTEAQLDALFDRATVGVAVYDTRGVLLRANRALEAMVDRTEISLIGIRNERRADLLTGAIDGYTTQTKLDRIENPRFVQTDFSLIRDGEGRPQFLLALVRDTTEHLATERRLQFEATHDPLTRLPNRSYLVERMRASYFGEAPANGVCAIVYLDVNGCDSVTPGGSASGDEMVAAVATRLAAALELNTFAARFDGNAYVVLMDGLPDRDSVARAVDRIVRRLTEPIVVGERDVHAIVRAGIAVVDRPYESPMEMIRDAETAMRDAESHGRSAVALFSPDMHDRSTRRAALGAWLRRALERDQFYLAYQPIVATADRTVHGFEALLRWEHPELGSIPPAEFIPLAEELGLILPIGRWVFDRACAQMASWRKEGLDVSQLSMAVNASVHEIVAPDYAAYLERTIARHGLTAQQIVIEVTESAVLQSDRFAAGSLETLKALGVELAIDDFGTGYSSLRYLLEFPFSQLKIDGSFVRGADGAIASEAIVSTIVTLAASAGMSTVAEGVETEAQAARLVELGVDALQGYFFSRPISDSSVIELLRKPRLHLVAK